MGNTAAASNAHPSSSGNTLTLRALRRRYGRREVLRGVDVGPLVGGTVTGLIGPNAAGKSTLVKAVAGIGRIDGGAIEAIVGGRRLEGRALREAIGYVPQELPGSASLTAFETVLVSSRRGGMWRVGDDALGLAADGMERLGIGHLADRGLGELSGGQRQLVAVAQMLVRRPAVMLLDEPTSALDLRHQVELLRLIRREARETGAVAVVAIHDLNLAARYCDGLVVLAGGVTRAQGHPADVLEPGLLDEVYGIRARVLDDAGVPVVCPVPE
ncbi:ABC transporter ATP-binding protein [uncultured Corynebacterium sp.]|uniref:ABC transporter ATP-binding protein n=1 Tax=uncultured Corynebacterium sp. TaxID=159447 RepID=UPI0025ED59C6|nr:ABC transporter ATP-binding protein [uncultured Corynebacterium sp.]